MPLLDNVAVSELEQHCLLWGAGFPRAGTPLPAPGLGTGRSGAGGTCAGSSLGSSWECG